METVVGKQEPNDIRVFKPLVTFHFPFPIAAPAPIIKWQNSKSSGLFSWGTCNVTWPKFGY